MSENRVTKKEVQSVDVEYAICSLCDQEYEPEEMTAIYADPEVSIRRKRELVWLNKREDRETIEDALTLHASDRTELCPGCAENVGLGTHGSSRYTDIGLRTGIPDLLPSDPTDLAFVGIMILWAGMLLAVML